MLRLFACLLLRTAAVIVPPRGETEVATLERMKYWQNAGEPLPPTSRYLVFTNDIGATNNLRIGWEMTGVVAQYTDRTLVLPPAKRVYLLDYGFTHGRNNLTFPGYETGQTKTKVEDLINLAQLRAHVPTLTWDEFEARTGLSFSASVHKAGRLYETGLRNGDQCHSLKEFQAVEDTILYMDGEKLRQGISCGRFDTLGGPLDKWRFSLKPRNWALLTHGFVWHPDAFAIAAKVVSYLGLFKYNALHGRYGDLQYQQSREEPSRIFLHWPSLLTDVKSLYVASDNPEKFNNLKMSNVDILTWDDLFKAKTGHLLTSEKAKYTPERWFKLMGPVEELICTFSRLFVGTQFSTFSGHIMRMRTHSQAPITESFFHTTPERPGAIRRALKEWDRQPPTFRRLHHDMGDIFLQVDATTHHAASGVRVRGK